MTTVRLVRVGSRSGLHARPAAKFVRAVADSGLPVTLSRPGGSPVNAASLLALISLDVHLGDEVEIAATGDGSETVVAELASLLERDLDVA
jgi:phosphocarrier protein HPr